MSGKLSYFIDWFPQKPVVLAPGKRYCIGRGGGNEFYLPDVRASREHAEIKWDVRQRSGRRRVVEVRTAVYVDIGQGRQKRLVSAHLLFLGPARPVGGKR